MKFLRASASVGAATLLCAICATGAVMQVPGAAAWVFFDLGVSLTAQFLGATSMLLRLTLFYLAALAACIAWLGWDASHHPSALGTICLCAVGAYGIACVGQSAAQVWRLYSLTALELADLTAYLMVVVLLIAALLLPVPAAASTYGPFLGTPMPPITALAGEVGK